MDPLPPQAFLELFIRRFAELGGTESVQPQDGDPLFIKIGDMNYHLRDELREFNEQSTDSARSEALDCAIHEILKLRVRLPRDEFLKRVRISIRDRVFIEFGNLQSLIIGGPKFMEPHLFRPLPDMQHLVQLVMLDLGKHIRFIDDKDLSAANIGIDEAFETAWNNSKPSATETFHTSNCLPHLHWSRSLNSLLFPELFAQVEVMGDPLVLPISAEAVVLTGTQEHDSHWEEFSAMCEQLLEFPWRALAPKFLTLREGHWAPWELSPDMPQYERLRALVTEAEVKQYEQQRNLLGAHHAKHGPQVFVADANIMKPPHLQEHKRSFTFWTANSYVYTPDGPIPVTSWLPKTDLIVFLDLALPKAEQVVALVEWDLIAPRYSQLLQRVPDLYPYRFAVREIPPLALLKELDLRGQKL